MRGSKLQSRDSGMIGGDQLAEQVAIKSILFARAATTRTWCREHASRKFSWTTSDSMGLVERCLQDEALAEERA